MSKETLQAVHDAIEAHARDISQEDGVKIANEWFVGVSLFYPVEESHSAMYFTSGRSPYGAYGVACIALADLKRDLTEGTE